MGRADEGVDEGDGVEAGEGGDLDGGRQRAGVVGRKCRWGQDGDCYVAIVPRARPSRGTVCFL